MAIKQDKSTTDIRRRLKNAGVVPFKYAKGVGKLMLQGSMKSYASSNLPVITSMLETNQDVFQTTIKFLKNPADVVNTQVTKAMGSEDYKALQQLVKNAVDDLKSGNLYDANRDRSEFGTTTDNLLSDFGGFDMDGFDDNGDWAELDFDPSIDNDIKIAEIQEASAGKRTEATISAIGSATDAITKSQTAANQNNIRLSMKQHSQSMSAMQNILTTNAAVFESVNANMNAMMAMSREAHNQVLDEMKQMRQLLSDIKDGVTPKPNENNKYREQNEIFDYNGAINLKNYFKGVKRNVNDKFSLDSISMMTAGLSIKQLAELNMDNPLTLISDMVLNAMMPQSFKKGIGRFNKNLGSFTPALLSKLYTRGTKSDDNGETSFKDLIAGLFGVKAGSRSDIRTDQYNYLDKANFTNKTVKAIEEVIPMWLARIDSHISGQQMQVYNYQTGKLDKVADTVAKYQHSVNDLVGRLGDTAYNIRDRADLVTYKNSNDKDAAQKYVHQYLQKIAEDGKFVNPFNTTDEKFRETLPGDYTDQVKYAGLIRGILKSLPREQLMAMSKDIHDARLSRDRDAHNTSKSLQDSGLIAAFSNFMEEQDFNKITNATRKERTGLSSSELEKLLNDRKYDQLYKGGTGATNVLLADINKTLKRGIITYSYNMGKGNSALFKSNPEFKGLYEDVLADANKLRIDEVKKTDNEIRETANQKSYTEKQEYETKRIVSAENFNGIVFDPKKSSASYENAFANIDLKVREESNDPAVMNAQKLSAYLNDKKNKTGLGKAVDIMQKAATKPFQLVTDAMNIMDGMMFKVLYGEDVDISLASNNKHFLISSMTDMLKAHFMNFENWFKEHVGKPIKDLFFGEKGIVTKGRDYVKGKATQGINFIKDRAFGTKGEDGFYHDGMFSSQMNKLHGAKDDFFSVAKSSIKDAVGDLLYGKSRNHGGKINNFSTNEHGLRVYTGETTTDYGDGIMGSIRKGFGKFKEFMLGADDDFSPQSKESKRLWKLTKDEASKAYPGAIKGAVKGAAGTMGLGILGSLWLPGGPIFGALLGAGAGFIGASDKLKDYIFGKEIMGEDGKPTREGKLISRRVYEGAKKFVPKVGGGFAIGSILGNMGLLPLGMGPIFGGILGSMGGMIGASEQMKKLIFGVEGDDESGLLSKNFRDKFMKAIPSGILGGASGAMAWGLFSKIGFIPGLAALPGGPILAGLGAMAGMFNHDKMEKWLFGEEVESTDSNGKKTKTRKGGMFAGLFNFGKDHVFDPFFKKLDSWGNNIGDWFDKSVVGPFSRAIDPFKEQMHIAGSNIKESLSNIGDSIKSSIDGVFEKHVGIPMGEFFKTKVIDPLGNMMDKLFSSIGKVIGAIISAPFKAFEFLFPGGNSDADDSPIKNKGDKRGGSTFGSTGDKFGNFLSKFSSNAGGWWERNVAGRVAGGKRAEWAAKDREIVASNRDKRLGKFGDAISSRFKRLNDWFAGDKTGNIPSPTADMQGYYDSFGNFHTIGLPGVPSVVANETVAESKNSKKRRRRKKGSNNKSDSRESTTPEDKMQDLDSDTEKSSDSSRSSKPKSVRGGVFGSHKTNNKYLSEISKGISKIHNEIAGQLGGTGWNIAYIKTLLEKKFGMKLAGEELPAEMEGSKSVKKRRGFFGKVKDAVFGKFGEAKDWISEKASSVWNTIATPFRAIFGIGKKTKDIGKAVASKVGGFFKGLGKGLKHGMAFILENLANITTSIVSVLADGAKLFAATVANLGIGVSKFLRETAPELAANLAKGAGTVIKDLASGTWAVGKGIVKGVWKGTKGLVKGTVKGIAHGIGWTAGKIADGYDRIRGIPREKTKIKKLGVFQISGGFLDTIKDPLSINVGSGPLARPFPYVSLLNGNPSGPITTAIPVYVAGSAGGGILSGSSGGDLSSEASPHMRKYKSAYKKTDSTVSRSKDPKKAYDEQIANATSMEEIQAIQASQQLNSNAGLLALNAGSGSSGEKRGGLLSTLLGAFGSGGGIGKTLLTLLGGTALGQAIKKLGVGAMGFLGNMGTRAGATASSLLLPALGMTQSIASGNYDMAIGTGVKTAVKKGGGYLARSAAQVSGNVIADFTGSAAFTRSGKRIFSTIKPTAASTIDAAGNTRSTTILAHMMNGIRKIFNSKTVQKALGKFPKLNKFISAVSAKLGTSIAKVGSSSFVKFLNKAAIPIAIASAVYDFTSGCMEAANVLKIPAETLTKGMRLAAGVAKAISGFCFGIIPISWLAETFYDMFADDEDEAALDNAQAELKAKAAAYNDANGTSYTVEEYNDKVANQHWWTKIKNWVTGDNGTGSKTVGRFGTGKMSYFNQTAAEWNQNKSLQVANAGCGPTVAAMVASAYGKNGNPVEASESSIRMGMRDYDGGTNPDFFNAYGANKGIAFDTYDANATMTQDRLSKNQPVVFMGQGGAFGDNMHYLVADKMAGSNRMNVVDPLTGKGKPMPASSVIPYTKTALYSRPSGGTGKRRNQPSNGHNRWGKGDSYNGMFYYSQGDYHWKDMSTGGKQTIGKAGCVIAALAMCISQIAGTAITPADIVSKYSFVLLNGNMQWYNMNTLAAQFGGECHILNSKAEILDSVAAGMPVLIYGSKKKCPICNYKLTGNAEDSPHAIVIASITPDKKTVKINDPGNRQRLDKSISVDDIKGWSQAWAFSKTGKGVIGAAADTSTSSSSASGVTGISRALEVINNHSSSMFNNITKAADSVGNSLKRLFGMEVSSDQSDTSTSSSDTSNNSGMETNSFLAAPKSLTDELTGHILQNTAKAESSGRYDAITANDNGSYSVGLIQEHGGKADRMFKSIAARLSAPNLKQQALKYAGWAGRSLTTAEANEMKNFLNLAAVKDINKSVQDAQAAEELYTNMKIPLQMYQSGKLMDPRSVIIPAGIGNTGPAHLDDWMKKYTRASSKEEELSHVRDSLKSSDSYWGRQTDGQENHKNQKGWFRRIDNDYATAASINLRYGAGPGLENFDPRRINFGTGALSTTATDMSNYISRFNNRVETVRNEAKTDNAIDKIANTIQEVASTSTSNSSDKLVEILATTMGQMVELLRDIKNNTAQTAARQETAYASGPSVATTRGTSNSGLNGSTRDVGASIVDKLTSK